MLIETHGLVRRYGETEALAGIDFALEAGAIVGLLGPNGAGKTTLIETLEGLRKPTAGSVRVLGIDPTSDAPALKERIGVQLQSTALPEDLTVGETLRLYASFYTQALPIDQVLDAVGLTDKQRGRVRTLSGGQRQRLAIGMSLINDPELLLLDEPTAGLDPAGRRELHRLIRSLASKRRAILMTTHYLEEAEAICDRVVVLRRGRIVADGTPLELLRHAAGASTVWLRVDGALDPGALITAGTVQMEPEGGYLRFQTTDPAAFVSTLGDVLRKQTLSLTDLRLKRPTLEDVYLELVAETASEGVSPR